MQWWQQQRVTNDEIVPLGTAPEVGAVLDKIGAVQGDVLYRGPSNWNVLAPGVAGRFLKTNGAGVNPAWDIAAGAFTALTDTPAAYTGAAGKAVAVNAGETGLEFVTAGGGGGGVVYTSLLAQDFATINLTTTPVVVTGLSAYDEILIMIDTATTDERVQLQLSPDGGATWRTSYSRMYVGTWQDSAHALTAITPGLGGADISMIGVLKIHNTALYKTIFEMVECYGATVYSMTYWPLILETHDALRIYMLSGSATAGVLRIVGVKY